MTKYFFGKPIESGLQNRFEEQLKKDMSKLRSRINTRDECINKSLKKEFRNQIKAESVSEPSAPIIVFTPIINYYVLSPVLQERTYSLTDLMEVKK